MVVDKLIGQHRFNKCVDSSLFNTQGLLKADVPLGQSQLMTYELSSQAVPFTVEAVNGSRYVTYSHILKGLKP